MLRSHALSGHYLRLLFTHASRSLDGVGQRGMTDPALLRRAALVSALCLKRLDGMDIQVGPASPRHYPKPGGGVKVACSCSSTLIAMSHMVIGLRGGLQSVLQTFDNRYETVLALFGTSVVSFAPVGFSLSLAFALLPHKNDLDRHAFSIESPVQGHMMNLHVALGVGTLQLYTVGNAEGGWQYVAAGEPFSVSAKLGSSAHSSHAGAPR